MYDYYNEENKDTQNDTAYSDPFMSSTGNGGYTGQGQMHYEEPERKHRNGLKIALCMVLSAVLIGTAVYTAIILGRTKIAGVSTENHIQSTKSASVQLEKPASAATTASVSRGLTAGDNEIETITQNAASTVIDVADLVEEVMPCVVSVTDNLKITSNPSYNPFSYFFGYSQQNEPTTKEQAASGSGIIIGQSDTELLIVTNNHVIDNSGNYTSYTVESAGVSIVFCDGTTANVTIKGTDSERDLAVLAADLSDISDETKEQIRIAVIGSSDKIRVGNSVIAIGNALGYGQSVTLGIISAKERKVTFSDGSSQSLLQTDAAINPGNSGGGLFNMNGELIGINSAKYSNTDVEGMGFAIPLSDVSDIIEDLMNKETIAAEDQGYVGINGETIPDSYIANYGYPAGVSITRIGEGSPAETAGLQIYDIITAVDGKEVSSMSELKAEIQSHAAGETITLSVSRPDGRSFKELTFDVTLVRYSDLE